MIPAASLRDATDTVLEGVALNHAQHRALFDPSPARDSLAERIVELRRHGVPVGEVRGLLADIRAVLELNAREGQCQTELAGELDRLAHVSRLGNRVSDALTVRGLVRALREPLSTLLAPEQAAPAQLVEAHRIVGELIDSVPRERLCSPTLAHELGGRRHRKLLALADGAGA